MKNEDEMDEIIIIILYSVMHNIQSLIDVIIRQ